MLHMAPLQRRTSHSSRSREPAGSALLPAAVAMTLRLILLIASAADCSNSTPPQPLPADATGCVGEICPSLAMLAVSPLQLFPPFSPDTHDYYLRCSSGQNALTVSMAGSTNALTAMITPT